jgi:hypothetical protein
MTLAVGVNATERVVDTDVSAARDSAIAVMRAGWFPAASLAGFTGRQTLARLGWMEASLTGRVERLRTARRVVRRAARRGLTR